MTDVCYPKGLPRIMWVWGQQFHSLTYAAGLYWSRVPVSDLRDGDFVYRRGFVVEFNPRVWMGVGCAIRNTFRVRTW